MLDARWREVARAEARRVALVDAASGRSWTFAELERDVDRCGSKVGLAERVVFPTGRGPEFIQTVLLGWREGCVVCPLDAGQVAEGLRNVPGEFEHVKLTSATTGGPRLVGFTSAQLRADADKIVAMMGLVPERPNLGVLSLAHSYGFSNLVLPLLLHGIPLVLVESPLPEALRAAAQGGVRWTLPAVPALWRTWLESDAIPDGVELAISAGAPLPVALEREIFEKRRLKVHNFYGATECGGIAYDPSPEPRAEDGGVGRTMPGVELSVAEDGCLEVRGPSVGAGYWPVDVRHLDRGRYRTGDVAEVRDGWVYLRGRATDLINVAGRKVAPEVVESALAGHPGVRGCVVFGAPDVDSVRQDRMVAVVAAEGVTEAALRAHLLERLPAWQVPREWCWVSAITPNLRGKVSRASWRQRFLAGEFGA